MTGASTLELWCALVSALFVAFLLGASFGYILAIRQLWRAVDMESVVGQDVSDAPSFLHGQQILREAGGPAEPQIPARTGLTRGSFPSAPPLPYESALKDRA